MFYVHQIFLQNLVALDFSFVGFLVKTNILAVYPVYLAIQ